MRKRTIKIILLTVVVSGVLGAAVAVAAGPPSWAGSGQPRATTSTQTTQRQHLRARDGTGAGRGMMQSGTMQRLHARDGSGPRHQQQAARSANPDCPYR